MNCSQDIKDHSVLEGHLLNSWVTTSGVCSKVAAVCLAKTSICNFISTEVAPGTDMATKAPALFDV